MERRQLVIVCDSTEESGMSVLVGCVEVFVAILLLKACLQTLCFVFLFARRVVLTRDGIVSIVTRLCAGLSGVQFVAVADIFFFSMSSKELCGPPGPLHSGYSGGLMLRPHIIRALRLRMKGGTFLFLLCAAVAFTGISLPLQVVRFGYDLSFCDLSVALYIQW